MEYKEIKRSLTHCPDLSGLDEASVAALLWRADEQTLEEGAVVYAENEKLDYTFCLLLSGDLILEKGGSIIGGIFEQQIFGEMAYFTNERARTATVRVGSPQAVILRFKVTPAELASPSFCELKKALELHTWNKFVNNSQCGAEREEIAMAD